VPEEVTKRGVGWMKKVFYNPIGTSKEPLLKKVRCLIKQGKALNFLYIVPTRGMLHKIKKELLKDTGIKGFIPGSVTTFDHIVTKVLDAEGIRITEMDDFTRYRCVEEAVKALREQGKLSVLKEVSMFPGFISALVFMIGEIKRSGLTPEALLNKITAIKNASEKIKEIMLIYDRYQHILARNHLFDPEEKYLKAREVLNRDVSFFEDIELIVIDEFADFEPQHIELLKIMAEGVDEVIINIPYKKLTAFSVIERTLQQLKSIGFEIESREFPQDEEALKPLHLVSRYIFENQSPAVEDSSCIRIARFPSKTMETSYIAREIKRLITDRGWKPEDFAVVVRNIDDYRETIHSVFGHEGIPLNFSRETGLDRIPVVRDIMNLLSLSYRDFDRTGVIKFLHSPYITSIKPETKTFLLEKLRQLRMVKGLNKIPELEEELSKFSLPEVGEIREFVAAARNILKGLGLEKGIYSVFQRDCEGKQHIFARDVKALQAFHQVLESLIKTGDLFGNETISLGRFISLLEFALANRKIKLEKGAPHGVSILSPSGVRGLRFKGVFCVGLSEGNFPKAPAKHLLCDEEEAGFLVDLGIKLDTPEDAADMERLFFNIAVSAAEEFLYLTYSDNREDDPSLASSFILNINELFGSSLPEFTEYSFSSLLPSSLEETTNISDFKKTFIEQYVADRLEADQLAGAFETLTSLETDFIPAISRAGRNLQGGYRGLECRRELMKTFGEDYAFSASQLEAYGKCPFKFYCRYVLGLEPIQREVDEFSAIDRGSLYHAVLAEVYQRHKHRIKAYVLEKDVGKQELLNDLYADLDRVLREKFEEILQLADRGRMWSLRFRDVHQKLRDFISGDMENARLTGFYPVLFEENFVFTLEREKERIVLKGKIDRVDMAEDGRCVVYDYKTSRYGVPSINAVERGLSFQIPLYIMACENRGLKPLGGGYLILNSFEVKGGIWSRPLTGRRNPGVVDEEKWEKLMESIRKHIFDYRKQIIDGYFPPEPQKGCDAFCDYKKICRNPGW